MTTVANPTPPTTEVASSPSSPTPPRRTVLGFVATRRIVEVILTVVLGVGSGLLFYGSHFGLNMVHSQLSAQDITFPVKGSPGLAPAEFPGLQRYAGQKVDTGPKAKAYANQFIAVHLKAAGGDLGVSHEVADRDHEHDEEAEQGADGGVESDRADD